MKNILKTKLGKILTFGSLGILAVGISAPLVVSCASTDTTSTSTNSDKNDSANNQEPNTAKIKKYTCVVNERDNGILDSEVGNPFSYGYFKENKIYNLNDIFNSFQYANFEDSNGEIKMIPEDQVQLTFDGANAVFAGSGDNLYWTISHAQLNNYYNGSDELITTPLTLDFDIIIHKDNGTEITPTGGFNFQFYKYF